jgi:hypothetical protein
MLGKTTGLSMTLKLSIERKAASSKASLEALTGQDIENFESKRLDSIQCICMVIRCIVII